MIILSATELETEALKLPPNERTRLIESLISSLQTEELSEIDDVWFDEAIKRFRAYLNGEIQARPAEHVLNDAFARLGQCV